MTTIIQVTITDEQLDELLTCGLNGGINYWARVENIQLKPSDNADDEIGMAIVRGNAKLTIQDTEDDGKIHFLDSSLLKNGVAVFHELCPTHWAEVRRGECDAGCGDAFIQCCLFGQVLYG